MSKCVCFGEVMMRLCAPEGLRLDNTGSLEMTFGGAEANVAVSIANFGLEASYATKLPDNAVTAAFIKQMRALNVDTSSVALGGERMGVYFVEKAVSVRPAKIVYDRKHSSISEIKPGDIDWDKAFEGADRFHWSGITPALSEAAALESLRALESAKRHGLTVSCDINYRPALWTAEEASRVLTPMMDYVDILIANESEPKLVFGISADEKYYAGGSLSAEGYADIARQISARFPVKKCCFAIREGTNDGRYIWSGLLYDAKSNAYHTSKKYDLQIVDRIGGGDAFGAGIISATMLGRDDAACVEFAAAASALKHTFAGDFNRASLAEVDALIASR